MLKVELLPILYENYGSAYGAEIRYLYLEVIGTPGTMDRSIRVEQGPSTGCSMHAKKTTLAIASVSSTHQLPVALSMAARVLRVAGSINNTPRLALFGSGISDARPSSVKNVSMLKTIAVQGWRDASGLEIKDVNVVVGANDLAILRLVPSRVLGEVCDVPPCEAALCSVPPNTSDLQRKTVEETIDCLLREPPVEYKYESDLPFSWQEHKDNMSGFRWVRDLWKQS